jgi:CHAT domain-containing protein
VSGAPLIAHVAVAYAPSLAILQRLLQREQCRDASATALVGSWSPEGDAIGDDVLGEVQQVAQRFGTHAVVRHSISRAIVAQEASSATVIHLACHGFFDPDDPLASGLEVADGVLTGRDWMQLRLKADLVTLSACDTGAVTAARGDEISGLTRALLIAGATSTLVTLWRVYSDAALSWMTDFYERVWTDDGTKRLDEATAFQQATLALMARNPDVVAWAPFVLVGDWR